MAIYFGLSKRLDAGLFSIGQKYGHVDHQNLGKMFLYILEFFGGILLLSCLIVETSKTRCKTSGRVMGKYPVKV